MSRHVARWSKAPWVQRPLHPTLLSRDVRTIWFKRPGERRPPNGHGQIDYRRHLWQHSSGQKGISGMLYLGHWFAYGFDDEWALIRKHAYWIEFQDRTTKPWTLYRISVARARRLGHWEHTPNGDRWLVPIEAYEVVKMRVARAS